MVTDLREYYTIQAEKEWQRLKKNPVTELEFENTKRYIEKYLNPEDKVLDIGGGPGRYSFWLAQKGNKVLLADYTPELLEKAEKAKNRLPKKVKENIIDIKKADVRNLTSIKDDDFDLTLCLGGVFSHLTDSQDRRKSFKELSRVTKKDGYIFISVIGLMAIFERGIIRKSVDEVASDYFLSVAKKGDYNGLSGFTACHFFTAEEFKNSIEKSGLRLIEMVGLEGFTSNLERPLREFRKNQKAWTNIKKIIQHYEHNLSMVDMSEHILAVCLNAK